MNTDDNADKTLGRVADYITRMLKHDIPEAKIRQALMHNKQREAEELFEQAFYLVELRAKAVVEAKKHEEAAKKAKLRSLTESGTKILGESETILLHTPVAPKTEPKEVVAIAAITGTKEVIPDTASIASAMSESTAPYQQHPVYPATPPAVNQGQPYPQPGTPIPAAGRHYGLRQAAIEAIAATKANPIAYTVAVACSYVAAGSLAVLVSLAANSLFKLRYNFLITPPAKLLSTLLGSIGVHIVVGALAYTLILVTTSLALYSGSQGRHSSLRVLFGRGINKIGKAGTATLLWALVTVLPMALIVVVPTILLILLRAAASVTYILPILYIAAFGWGIFSNMRYGLVPYVALFEKDVPLFKVFKRSKELLAGGGRRIILQGTILSLTALSAAGLLSGQSPRSLTASSTVAVIITLAAVSLIANALLVMLYRNRRAVIG